MSLGAQGYTLVEEVVVVTVIGIISIAFVGSIASYYVTITRTNELEQMTVSSQNVLRSTVENIRYGDGVRQTNAISDPNAPTGGWNTSDSNFVIILEVPAENTSHNYIIDPDTGSPYMNELVYYKNVNLLMERKLANPNASGDSLTTSCPPSNATTTCPADTELADWVNSMTFTLYDQNASQTTTPSLARSVGITLNMQRDAPGKPLNLTTNIRVTLRNNF
jgi:Tfp pilus assembly protein PilE